MGGIVGGISGLWAKFKPPSSYVLKRTLTVTLIAAAISISISTGTRWLIGAEADAVTIAVRIVLPFVIAIPLGLTWFSRLEKLERSYRELLMEASRLAHSANTDPMTGLLNRRSFVEQFERARMHKVAGSFIIADVDYLKAINDHYGHVVGDDAIIAAAEALKQVLGEESLIARIGGDEFCAFVPGGVRDADSLPAAVNEAAARNFRVRSPDTGLRLTISLAHQLCKPNLSFRDLVEQTDSNLYRKKRSREVLVPPQQTGVSE